MLAGDGVVVVVVDPLELLRLAPLEELLVDEGRVVVGRVLVFGVVVVVVVVGFFFAK